MSSTVKVLLFCWALQACKTTAPAVSQQVQSNVPNQPTENASPLQFDGDDNAHIGIYVVNAKGKTILEHQSNKYFVPASNVKIATLYAGLQLLKDSITGIRYNNDGNTLYIQPTGDPTLLHRDFAAQPVMQFLHNASKPIVLIPAKWQSTAYGKGWMWDDYNGRYMPERSQLPVYGNTIRWKQVRDSSSFAAMIREEAFIYSEPDIYWRVRFSTDTSLTSFNVNRDFYENTFTVKQGQELNAMQDVPYLTQNLTGGLTLLNDELRTEIRVAEEEDSLIVHFNQLVHSRPTKEIYKPLMFDSDNFFAEQILLMAANEKLGVMNEKKIIDSLLKTSFTDIPQKPVWVDGSGMSRYNLFTPQNFVWLLQQIKEQYGEATIKELFPAKTDGTLSRYFSNNKATIFAKTGTMSGTVAFSGYMYNQKNEMLVFSVMVNNHNSDAGSVYKSIAHLLDELY